MANRRTHRDKVKILTRTDTGTKDAYNKKIYQDVEVEVWGNLIITSSSENDDAGGEVRTNMASLELGPEVNIRALDSVIITRGSMTYRCRVKGEPILERTGWKVSGKTVNLEFVES